MSAFKRRAPASAQASLPGVRPCPLPPFQLQVSTGIPSLDDVLGGGLPLSSSLLVMSPDLHSAWGQLMQKYFIAQGLMSDQAVCIIADDDEAQDLVSGCMWVPPEEEVDQGAAGNVHVDDENEGGNSDGVKIAWRYEGMKRFSTTVSHGASATTSGHYCSNFDLTRSIPPHMLSKAYNSEQLRTVPVTLGKGHEVLQGIIRGVAEVCASHSLGPVPAQRALRISISVPPSFGISTRNSSLLPRFLHCLRALLRTCSAMALITLPPHLSALATGTPLGAAIVQVSDAAITLFSDSLNPMSSHHGVVQLHKLPSLNALLPASDKLSTLRGLGQVAKGEGGSRGGGGGENNLAFRCKRRVFVIETLHLDVEGGVGERRTAPPPVVMLPPASEHRSSAATQNEVPLVAMHAAVKGAQPAATELQVGDSQRLSVKPRKRVAFSDTGSIYDF